MAAYIATGKVKLIYRHLAQLGDLSVRAAEASECAADQGKFWQMRSQIYKRQSEVYSGDPATTLTGFARDLGLDTQTFAACLQSGKHRAAVEADYRAAQDEGVRSRPVFDINGTQLIGAQTFDVFQRVIDAALAK